MAEIVGSLFGVTPEDYQQARQAQADKMALDFAKLDPFQSARFAIGRGAYGLAGALGGALGAQDPELQLISARNAISKQIDYNDPASIMQGVQSLSQAGDTVGAMQLADVARKLQSEMAQTFQRTAAGRASLAQAAREKTQATPEKIQLAQALASRKGEPGSPEYEDEYTAQLNRLASTEKPDAMTPEMRNAVAFALLKGAPGSPEYTAEFQSQLARLTAKTEGREPTTNELTNARTIALQAGPVNSPEYNAAFMKEYNRLTAPKEGKLPSVGVDREAVSLELYDLPYASLTPKQRATVNKQVGEEQERKAEKGAPKILLPGERVEAKDWLKFEEFVEKQPTFKRTASIISAAPSVLRTIRQSTDNDFAARALPSSIARLFDEGVLSNNDVKNYAVTGGLDDRLATMASNFFTGTVTSVTKQQAERFMTSVYRGALIDQKNAYVKQAQRLGYADSPNYITTLRQIDEELAKFKPSQPAGTPSATTPAAGKTIAPRTATTGNPLVDKYLNPQ